MKIIGNALEDVLEIKALDFYHNDIEDDTKEGERALLAKILNYLVLINNEVGVNLAKKITSSKNMTLSISGLKSLCVYGTDIPFNFFMQFMHTCRMSCCIPLRYLLVDVVAFSL